MKQPGSDHPIAVAPNPHRLRVTFAGRTIADTTRALTVKEADYPPVHYVPRADADMGALQATSHHSHCPYKGDANYFSLVVDGRAAENAVWSYREPYPAVKDIKDHLAFYPDRVEIDEEAP